MGSWYCLCYVAKLYSRKLDHHIIPVFMPIFSNVWCFIFICQRKNYFVSCFILICTLSHLFLWALTGIRPHTELVYWCGPHSVDLSNLARPQSWISKIPSAHSAVNLFISWNTNNLFLIESNMHHSIFIESLSRFRTNYEVLMMAKYLSESLQYWSFFSLKWLA